MNYPFKTKEDVNVIAAKWNTNDDDDHEGDTECFTAALNLAEEIMRERNAYREIAYRLAKATEPNIRIRDEETVDNEAEGILKRKK